jgi:hypothetical protein
VGAAAVTEVGFDCRKIKREHRNDLEPESWKNHFGIVFFNTEI